MPTSPHSPGAHRSPRSGTGAWDCAGPSAQAEGRDHGPGVESYLQRAPEDPADTIFSIRNVTLKPILHVDTADYGFYNL